jgi:G6PDH family F420-dependent oxidoreductase
MKIGYFLSCEQYAPAQLVEQAVAAERSGFDALWISDQSHPWNDEQGQSSFVWAVIGAISQVCRLPITTAVTRPTVRIHPAVIAQAAATASVLLDGRFRLGLGTGEGLDEPRTGRSWPSAEFRLGMLEESISVIRELWSGEYVTRYGQHFAVENARIHTLPAEPVAIYISGVGPKSVELAGRLGDGFICTKADPAMVAAFRISGGGSKIVQGGYKVPWDVDLDSVDLTAHLGPFLAYVDAGYDEVYIAQIGGAHEKACGQSSFEFYSEQVLPRMRELAGESQSSR